MLLGKLIQQYRGNERSNYHVINRGRIVALSAGFVAFIAAPASIWALADGSLLNKSSTDSSDDISDVSFPESEIKTLIDQERGSTNPGQILPHEPTLPPENSSHTSLMINGQNIPVPENGSIHKQMQTNNGTTSVDLKVDNNSSQSTSNDVNSSTSISVYSQSNITGVDEVNQSRHRGRASSP